MGVSKHGGTMPGGVTPTCNDCGVCLCWDISEQEYQERKTFWDNWKCKDCKEPAFKSYHPAHAVRR